MSGLSIKPEFIIPCLSIYKGITYKLNNTAKGRIAVIKTPKPGSEEECQPRIEIINAFSRDIYQACKTHDHENTLCIMKIIREKFVIPDGEESLFYIIFTLLHEAGHWYDYHNRRDWYNKNFSDEPCEAEEYRQRPCEESADKFAMDHFEEAWNELTVCFPSGLMNPLIKND